MRLSIEDYKALMEKRQPKVAKYRNVKKEYNDMTFDSVKELTRYQDLLMWQQSGQITELERQRPFLIDVNGAHICIYYADFCYIQHGQMVVEDVKSKITRKHPVYALKRKLMAAVHGIEIQEK